ncbi:hypothetical protein JOF53_004742 [Crossiella equi]|uniref:Uncharacterized protein n=1 Tax=Crossiella equi TaxID=130796 RepID=A0ABS5AJK5_9PSEU|nr:hypothetical protein [Crossiella equi]MBP2475870.1 hypothetical protein [Crossiella equi]
MSAHEVKSPRRRADVANALEALAGITPENIHGWADLTNTVHWLLDDTWWDRFDPRESVGDLLRDEREAGAVKAVVTPLLEILDAYSTATPDETYLTHPRWPEVREAAAKAHRLLSA